MNRLVISIPEIEMKVAYMPDDTGSLDVWVHLALLDAIKLKNNYEISRKRANEILESHGLSKNPFDGRLWRGQVDFSYLSAEDKHYQEERDGCRICGTQLPIVNGVIVPCPATGQVHDDYRRWLESNKVVV